MRKQRALEIGDGGGELQAGEAGASEALRTGSTWNVLEAARSQSGWNRPSEAGRSERESRATSAGPCGPW